MARTLDHLCRYVIGHLATTDRWTLEVLILYAYGHEDQTPKYKENTPRGKVMERFIVVGIGWIEWARKATIVYPEPNTDLKWQYVDTDGKIVTI